MAITTTTHLNYRHTARAALEFYKSVFGGEITLLSYKDGHNMQSEGGMATEDEADEIMWGQVMSDKGFHVMGYDVPAAMSYDQGDKALFVALNGDSTDEMTAYWDGLKDGATVTVDVGPSAWGSPLYGMLKDKFGVTWILEVRADA